VSHFRAVAARRQSFVSQYLEGLCDQLYDFLRPRILHESSLDKLSELCTVVQALMALDPSIDMETDDLDLLEPLKSPPIKSPSSAVTTPRSSDFGRQASYPIPPMMSTPTRTTPVQRETRPLPNLQFSRLLLPILQDAQTRMVFRAQAIIQNEVLHYAPKTEDLDFPRKLGHGKRLSFWLSKEDQKSWAERGGALETRLPDKDIQDGWYPTLQTTLWVLSKLHTHVNVSARFIARQH
jgi:hypothetical protein